MVFFIYCIYVNRMQLLYNYLYIIFINNNMKIVLKNFILEVK